MMNRVKKVSEEKIATNFEAFDADVKDMRGSLEALQTDMQQIVFMVEVEELKDKLGEDSTVFGHKKTSTISPGLRTYDLFKDISSLQSSRSNSRPCVPAHS